jgi:hypothetical protein
MKAQTAEQKAIGLIVRGAYSLSRTDASALLFHDEAESFHWLFVSFVALV